MQCEDKSKTTKLGFVRKLYEMKFDKLQIAALYKRFILIFILIHLFKGRWSSLSRSDM